MNDTLLWRWRQRRRPGLCFAALESLAFWVLVRCVAQLTRELINSQAFLAMDSAEQEAFWLLDKDSRAALAPEVCVMTHLRTQPSWSWCCCGCWYCCGCYRCSGLC
jgi:hypothetical protein